MKEIKSQKIVNKIEKIRSQNNKFWMKLLSIALKRAPEESRKVIKKININDKKISKLISKI